MALEMRGKYWFSRFMIEGHSFARSTKTADRKLAEQIESVWRADAVKSLMISGEKPISLFSAIDGYLAERTGKGGQGNARVHFSHFKHIGDKPMKSIRLHEATEVIALRRAMGASHNTLCVAIAYWNALQNWCKTMGYTPGVKMQALEPEQTRIRYLTKAEEKALFDAIDPSSSYRGKNSINVKQRQDNVDLLTCLLHTGARLNEIQKMRWSQVSFESETVYVIRSKKGVSNTMFMSSALKACLLRRFNDVDADKDFIFPTKAGGKVNTKWIRDAVKRAGINEDVSKVTLHTARHTVATRCLKGGMSILEVNKVLGQKSINSTLVYTHVAEDEAMKRAATIFDVDA